MYKIKDNINIDCLTHFGFLAAKSAFAFIYYASYHKVSLDFTNHKFIHEVKKTPLIFISTVDREIHIFEHKEILNSDLMIYRCLLPLMESGIIEYVN